MVPGKVVINPGWLRVVYQLHLCSIILLFSIILLVFLLSMYTVLYTFLTYHIFVLYSFISYYFLQRILDFMGLLSIFSYFLYRMMVLWFYFVFFLTSCTACWFYCSISYFFLLPVPRVGFWVIFHTFSYLLPTPPPPQTHRQ